jgi:transposase
MQGKNTGQLNVYDIMVYTQMIPENHLLLKIDKTFDFEFIYDLIKDNYSAIGRESKDPIMMTKILLLEYLYKLSDVEVNKRTQTDVAFRWFLKLSMSDNVPDDTTISHFRTKRFGTDSFEELFNKIIHQCMEMNLVKSRRFQVDSTNIDGNVNYPSNKKLLRQAFERVLKEITKFDETLASNVRSQLDEELHQNYDENEKLSTKVYYEIVSKYLAELYINIHAEMDQMPKLMDSIALCKTLINQHQLKQGDKIISIVNQEARVAYKSPGHAKTGYKNSIIIDEDSELILSYAATPFNVNDDKLLTKLVDKVKENFNLVPDEVSADKGYASTANRSYLKDNDIISNIDFYVEVKKENQNLSISDCTIADDLKWLRCPNGILVEKFRVVGEGTKTGRIKQCFKVDAIYCTTCPKRNACHGEKFKEANKVSKSFYVPERYDAVIRDKKRVQSDEFKEAKNSRFKIERRFATGVRNHSMRRSRFIGLDATTKHIAMSNIAVNINRTIRLLYEPKIGAPKIQIVASIT